MKLALACLLSSGCASILGLDNTKFAFMDAPTDAPGTCDGVAATCVTSSTGRTLCGQLTGTGATAGMPVRVAAPTGGACSGSEGPCGFTVGAFPLAGFFAGNATAIAGTIDDCGRFAIPDLDAALADVAVLVTPGTPDFVATARIATGRMATPGIDTGVDALAVTSATLMQWNSALGADASTAYLVKYTANDAPLAGVRAEYNSGTQFGAPPTVPFAAYFAGAFDTVTAGATTTAAGGAALVTFTGNLSVEGLRTGHQRCKQGAAVKPNTIVYVVETNC